MYLKDMYKKVAQRRNDAIRRRPNHNEEV